MRTHGAPLLVVLATILASSGSSMAEDNRVVSDRWYVAFGGYVAELSTDASVGTGGVVATLIRAEDQLGLDERNTTIRLLADRRFGKRHSLGLEYFDIRRSGSTTLSETILFEEILYEVGATVSAEFDTELLQLTYKYAFVNDGRTEAGFQAGLSTWALSANLAGEATVDDGMGGLTTEYISAREDLLAPIPSLGLFMRHALSRRLVMQTDARFFRITLGDLEGRLIETKFSLDYFISRNVGVGIGVNGTDMHYRDLGSTPLLFGYRQNGVVLYLSLVF